jgi:Phage integrase family
MRHTALTNLAATGASPIAVMATAGHRSMSTTNRYLHLAGVVFRADADALERRLLGSTGSVEGAITAGSRDDRVEADRDQHDLEPVESSTDLSASQPLSAGSGCLNPAWLRCLTRHG